jgi:tetratricopeptide (TPR) repeat protein
LALVENDPGGALYYFRHVPPEGELRKSILMMTGESLYKLGRFEDALNCFMPVADSTDRSIDAHRWMAAIYFDIGAMDHALSQLNIILQLVPEDPRALRLAGTIYYDFENWDYAAEHFEKAYQFANTPSDKQDAGRELARTLVKMNEFSRARAICEQIASAPDIACVLAECLWVLEGSSPALECLGSVLERAPEFRTARLLEARILLEDGNPETTIERVSGLAENNPYDFDAQFILTTALRQAGRNMDADIQFRRQEKARLAREQMAELNQQAIQQPLNAQVRNEIAELCRTMGQLELAKIWERAAQGCSESETNSPTNAWIPKEQQIEF